MKRSYDYYKWRNWGILVAAFLVVFFHRYSTAVVADNLSRDMGLTGTQISNLSSMYFYAYALMQLPSGLLSDFFGPRRTVTLGMLLAGAGSVLFGLAPGVMVAYIARLLVGLGVSVVFISLLKVQAVWFPKERFATMTGITSLVGNFGGILATTPLALLVLAIGWQQSFIAIGIISLALVAAIWFFILDAPENVGYTRLGEGGNGKPQFGLAESIKKVASVPGTWLNAIVLAGLMGGIMSFSGLWGVPYLVQVYGFTKTQASNYVLLLNLGILLGSPVVGILADKLGSKKKLIVIGSGALTLFWVYVLIIARAMPPVWMLAPLYFIAGFLGIVFTLCFTQVKESNHPALSGTATGFINVAGFLATALLNLIIGWRLDARWDGAMAEGVRFYGQAGFQRAMLVLIIAAATAFVASLFLPKTKITK